MNKNPPTPSLGETAEAFGDIFSQSTKLGMALLGPLVSSSAQMVGSVLQRITSAQNGDCGCEIPPPCWEPQRLGEVTSFVCPGGTATIQLRINNCNWTSRKVRLVTAGQNTGITITPPDLALGPMQHGVIAVSLPVATSAGEGEEHVILILVQGCRDHFLRWIVNVTKKGIATCCDEVEVEDCMDYVHHWYDHFYCRRNCPRQG